MALYSYEAFSKEGKKVRGVIDASSTATVKEMLVRQGFYPITIALAVPEAHEPWYKRLFSGGVSTKDKIMFTKQFAVLLRSGIPMLQALELLADQLEGRIQSIIISVKDRIKEGSSFADALKAYPREFDHIYVQLVRAGEASGRLEVILERLTLFLEKREETANKVKAELQMPLIQLGIAALVVVILMVVVVPKMTEMIEVQGGTLPLPTRILISLSSFMQSYFIVVALLVGAGIAAFRYWKKTAAGARRIDSIKLKIPVVKLVTKTNAVVQFCYTLGMLLEGGVDLASALDIVCNVIDNRILADALFQARENIIREGKIAEYLRKTGMFPAIAIYLIRTGEESGQLDKMLLMVAHNYEEEMSRLTARLTGLLQPLTTVGMALIVGFIVIAIALPMMGGAGQLPT